MEKELSRYRIYDINNAKTDIEKAKMQTIHNTYKQQRQNIDYQFNQYLIQKYCSKFNRKSNFWSLFSLLDNITDLSDPDTNLPNSIHALQTAEAIRLEINNNFIGFVKEKGCVIYGNIYDIDSSIYASHVNRMR